MMSRCTHPVSRFTSHVSRFTCLCLLSTLCLLLPAQASGQARIVSLAPERGPTTGGTVVTLEVEGGVIFGPLEVEFGDRKAKNVRRVGLSTLEVVTPPGRPGPVSVRVVNGLWGTRTNPGIFTYVSPAPRLSRLTPSTAPVGSAELILGLEGDNFTTTSKVHVNGTTVPTILITAKRLEARLAAPLFAHARTLAVQVSDAGMGGGTSNELPFAVVNPRPEITGLDAPPLRTGQSAVPLTVRGRGFRPESRILVGGAPVPTGYRTDEELAAVLPAEPLAKPGDLALIVEAPGPGGGSSNAMTLSVQRPLPAQEAFVWPSGQGNAMTLSVQRPLPGRFLVFTSNRRGGRNHLFLLDRETGRLDPLEEANSVNGSDAYPSISADGRVIVFQSDRDRGQTDVLLFDRETRTLDPLPEANHPTAFDGFPRISADGRFIVFESDRLKGRPKIFLLDRETRRLSELGQANEATADDGLAAISN